MRGWLIGAAVLLAGCVDDHLTACGDGTACPAGRVCDPAHHGCAAPDQLTACTGTADGASCHTSEFDGACFDGVCLVPGCGNRVVEPGEQCDDGNHIGDDGCSADCRSDEQCGNGVVDGALGEACDDGNLASHDGCNSRCQPESPQWTIDPAILRYVPSTSAFDEAHGTLVVVGGRVTWLWDGAAWHTPSALVPAVDSWVSAAYDASRMRVVAIGKRAGAFVVAEWDGSQWTEATQSGTPPSAAIFATVYDPVRHAVMWISKTHYGYLRAGAWTLVDILPFTTAAPVHAAFDAIDGTVFVDGASPAATWILDGSTWTANAALPSGTAHALVYDGDRHQVLAVGGTDPVGTTSSKVFAWTGSAWSDTGAVIPPRGDAVTWWDAARHVVGIAGGTTAQTPLGDVMDLAGTTVTPHPVLQPTATGPLGYDLARDALVQSDAATGTYAWSGSWQQVSPTHVSSTAVLVYDPVRTAMLAYDAGSVLELDTGWRTIASATTTPAVTYDFARRGVVSIVPSAGTFVLPSVGASTLTSIAAAPPRDALAAAYDPDTRDIVGVTTAGLVELAGTQWMTSAFAPTGSYALVSALQTSSIVFVPEDGNAGSQLWERRGGAFREIGQLPFSGTFAGAVERGRGRLVIELSEPIGTVFLERQLTSSLADETCAPTDDADGDGAAGCADPDCWQTCGPACPVATSCP